MFTPEAIRFMESEKSFVYTDEFNRKYDLVVRLLKRGENFEKRWNDLKDLMDSTSVMDKLEVEYLGSKPRTKHQRLNEVIDRLGIYMQVGKMSEIIELLVKLRDEEENV